MSVTLQYSSSLVILGLIIHFFFQMYYSWCKWNIQSKRNDRTHFVHFHQFLTQSPQNLLTVSSYGIFLKNGLVLCSCYTFYQMPDMTLIHVLYHTSDKLSKKLGYSVFSHQSIHLFSVGYRSGQKKYFRWVHFVWWRIKWFVCAGG